MTPGRESAIERMPLRWAWVCGRRRCVGSGVGWNTGAAYAAACPSPPFGWLQCASSGAGRFSGGRTAHSSFAVSAETVGTSRAACRFCNWRSPVRCVFETGGHAGLGCRSCSLGSSLAAASSGTGPCFIRGRKWRWEASRAPPACDRWMIFLYARSVPFTSGWDSLQLLDGCSGWRLRQLCLPASISTFNVPFARRVCSTVRVDGQRCSGARRGCFTKRARWATSCVFSLAIIPAVLLTPPQYRRCARG